MLCGHTPYRQWKVYRQRHLLIVASKTDQEGFRLCRALAETLAAHLPDSKARPSRAPNAARVASLLGTGQMDVAVLPRGQATALATDPQDGTEPLRLMLLMNFGAHVLVSRADFPDDHAYQVVRTLDLEREVLPGAGTAPGPFAGSSLPLHPGAREYLRERGQAE